MMFYDHSNGLQTDEGQVARKKSGDLRVFRMLAPGN